MLTSGRVVAFAPSADLDGAVAFYRDKLGLELSHRDGYAAVFKSGDDTIRVALVGPFEPQRGTVVGWEVADVHATARWLVERGVELMEVPGLGQDELRVWSPPGGGAVAWFKDPGGNTLSISSPG
ncbi:MAG: VOC family protein [bacterium]